MAKMEMPQAVFALNHDMITDDEYQAIMYGDAILSGNKLMNINSDKMRTKTGETVRVYIGRASQLMIDDLLAQDPSEKH